MVDISWPSLLNGRLQNHYADIEEVFVKQILLLLLAVNSDVIKRKKGESIIRNKWRCECPKNKAQNQTFKWILPHDHQKPRAKAQDIYVIYWYIAAMEIFSILLRNSLNTPVFLEFWMVQKSLSTPPVFSVENHCQFKTEECKFFLFLFFFFFSHLLLPFSSSLPRSIINATFLLVDLLLGYICYVTF